MANDIPIASIPVRPVDPARLFQALGNPTRMTLLKQMATGGALCVNDCVNIAHRNQVAVSRHLALLWRAGAVIKVPAADGDKRRQCYAIHPSVLRAVPGGKELDFGTCVVRLS